MPAVVAVPAMVYRQGTEAGQWREYEGASLDSNEPASPPGSVPLMLSNTCLDRTEPLPQHFCYCII